MNVVLQQMFGFRGLALGTSLAALFNAVTLLVLLRRALGGINGRRLGSAFGRIAVASVVMGITALLVDRTLRSLMPGADVVLQVLRLGTAIGAALLALTATARALRIREFDEAFAMVARRFRRIA